MKFKKILCVFIVICIVGTLSGCLNRTPGNIQEHPTAEENIFSFINVMIGDADIEDWHENNVITSIAWQKLKLMDDQTKEYPALSAAFDKYNEESLTEAKALMYEFTSLAEEMEGDEYNPAYCQSEAKIYMQRADNHIVSFLESVDQYTGGIHPNYFVNGRNYNPDTGENFLLTDILTNTNDLPSILEKKITEKYSYVTFYDLKDTFSKYKPEEFTWTIDYQGITFWFSPYEIASYSVGTLSSKIWFDEFPDMFNKEYMESPENYVISIPVGHDIELDLVKDDGAKDSVYTEKVLDQYGSYNMLSVTVNGKTCTDEINYAYDFDVYLAHIGNKNYIYSNSVSDNDYHMFCTWDINGAVPGMTQNLYGTEVDYEYIEEGYEEGTVYKQVFNNPEFLRLATKFEILGTRGATAAYKLNEATGNPEMTDEAYTFTYGHDVKTIVSLEAKLLPEMEKTELPSGTLLTPYQTDGKSFVDLKTENGKIVRLSVDASDWPVRVNDIPEEECFEELLYAG